VLGRSQVVELLLRVEEGETVPGAGGDRSAEECPSKWNGAPAISAA
jgi:hypothetical protein